MKQIFKYLTEHKGAVAIIIFLLIIQAYCDLSLPSYTSDIVDVGIEQGGIEHEAMEEMREETFDTLCLFMSDEDEKTVREAYEFDEKKNRYIRKSDREESIEKLDPIFAQPMAMIGGMQSAKEENFKQFLEGVKAGAITKDTILQMEEKALEQYDTMSDSIVSQMAIMYTKSEYEAMNYDTGKIQTRYLIKTGAKMLGLSILMAAAAILGGFFSSKTGAKIGMNLRSRVFEKVVSFSNREMDQFSTASLITRSTNDIQQVQMVAIVLLRMVLYAPIIGIGGVLKVIHTKTGMGWIIVVAVAVILLIVGILVFFAMPKFKIMQKLVDRMNLVSREILTGIPVIRAFSREKFEEKRFDGVNQDLMKTQLFTNRVMTFMMPAMMLVMNGITIMIVWFGAKGVDLGNLQVGDMIAFITYTMQIVMAFLMLTMVSIMLPRAGVAAERIQEVILTESSIHDAKEVQGEEKDFAGILEFHDVGFAYDGADEEAISHISFTARPGETTAIIGSTGCGKTTLLNLIPRFYDVTAGSITVDGIDVRDMSQKKLRSLIGYVPQKGILFSGTITSNLKFAGDQVTDEMMLEAADIAQATEFIESKEEKYESPIAQGGTNVSGGQKQRLSIARAIAKDPKIFLFDDSFSALDYKTDVALRKRLNEKVKDATVLIVAQRISTILHADHIIVLEEGRIAGMGTHKELLKSCEAYLEIAKSQLSEAELKGGAH
ncbi:MAG: ABC transporter ATP-binding protein [Lachnospiraceae bacterium]|nr:ABC transporter ATP-binding protein [Lachnospiraceae bacterium]